VGQPNIIVYISNNSVIMYYPLLGFTLFLYVIFLVTAKKYLEMSGNELRLIEEFDVDMEKIFKVRSLI